jgi:membrane-associated protease RseP (regulator of RpoE activity)
MRIMLLVLAAIFAGLGHGWAEDAGAAKATATGPLRGWLGLRLQDLAPDLAPKFGLPVDAGGALVADVTAQGPGQAAGLHPGDVIQAFGGRTVDSAAGLKALVVSSAGQDTVLKIWRNAAPLELKVKVGTKGGAIPAVGAVAIPAQPDLGLKVRAMRPAEAAKAQLDAGLVVERVAHGSPAEADGLLPGDILLELEHTRLAEPASLTQAAQGLKAGDTVLLRLRRGDRTLYQTLALPSAPVPALDAHGVAFTPIDVEYGTYWDEDTGPYTAVTGYSHDGQPLTRLQQFEDVIDPLHDPQATQLLNRSAAMQTGGVVMVGVGAAACVGGLGNLLYQVISESDSSSWDGPNLVPFAVLFGGGTVLWVGGAVIALVGVGNVRPKAVGRYNQVVEGMKNLSLIQMPDTRRMGLAYSRPF